MIAAPMSNPRLAAARPRIGILTVALLAAVVLLSSCGSTVSPTPRPSLRPSASVAAGTPTPEPTPSPTPQPTPTYTNTPDPSLTALIPTRLGSVTVAVPPPTDVAITPGDVGQAYGELGLRFRSLQIAYVPRPQSLSLFAVRMDAPFATTQELEPYLGTAGRYVGIALPEREPWELMTIDDRVVWVRPEDDATAAGTMIYTWTSDEYLFLLIGVDDELNRSMFAALPGEAAPTPTPRPSRSPRSSASASTEPSETPGG
jgi:hypothetical protein